MVKTIFRAVLKAFSLLLAGLSYISLRTSVAGFGLFLALTPSPLMFPLVDKIHLSAMAWVFEKPRGVSKIAIITVPRDSFEAWRKDSYQATELSALLANILHSPKTHVALVLDEPIDFNKRASDRFLEVLAAESKSEIAEQSQSLLHRRDYLIELLSDDRVVVGVASGYTKGVAPAFELEPVMSDLPELFNQWLWPICHHCEGGNEIGSFVRQPIDMYPILFDASGGLRIFHGQSNQMGYAGFLLSYWQVVNQARGDQHDLVWNPKQGVSLGQRTIDVSYSGAYFPLHNTLSKLGPEIEHISIDEALARRAFPNYLFLADDHFPIENIAKAFFSLQHEQTLFSPWWHGPLVRFCIAIFALFLLLAGPRLKGRTIAVAVVILILAGILGQFLMLSSRGMWIPLSGLYAYMLIGALCLLVWKRHKETIFSLRSRANSACLAQADMFAQEGRIDEAGRLLLTCDPEPPVLTALYEYADTYANSNNYDLAVRMYEEIQQRDKNFKDVSEKIGVLTQMLEPQSQEESFEQTTVLQSKDPADPSRLGRYEVNQELGRGAVGRVFLGFDPRIARKVAIKTLNYDQFQGNQLDDIKSRFFREAEAAGRLNHPNIVSVYDVGEEGNLAYIAMDYVEGKSLNRFVDHDKLLPVFEVYRIIADVASAIEYAHENNIIHRDIKPGNIMYNPSPYQVKVTDFGIARLVDDSKTSTGEILGSPLYMAPEQLKGKKVTRQADVFSLGVTFYQLLSGRLPFKGDNLAALTYEIIHGKHKNIRSVRKELPASAARIVNQALQKEPEDRYESAAEMGAVIRRAMRRDFAAAAKRIGLV